MNYRRCEKFLSRISPPLYVIPGNHDDPAWLGRFFLPPGLPLPADPSPGFSYYFDRGEDRFIFLDVQKAGRREGYINETQLRFVEQLIESFTGRCTIVVHNPPIPLGCDWMDKTMLIENGFELHKILSYHRTRLRCVLFGHVHQFLQVVRDGVLYVGGPSLCAQFSLYPGAPDGSFDGSLPAGFNVLRYFKGGISVLQVPIMEGVSQTKE